MLMPVGLKGKERKKYIEENAYKFATAPREESAPRKRGLVTAGNKERATSAPVVEEPKDDTSTTRQEGPKASNK